MGISTGVWFGAIHSYHDLNLILAPFTVPPAVAKTEFLEIAGGDGALDLTEKHGKVYYNDRQFDLIFTINPSDKMSFDEKATQVSNALNGKKCNITFDRDPEYFYESRCVVSEYMQDRRVGKIVVSVITRPYKMKHIETVCSFELTETEQTITLTNGKKEVTPVIECTDESRVVFGNASYGLAGGAPYEIPEIYIPEGVGTFKVSGTGTITFTYREGEL